MDFDFVIFDDIISMFMYEFKDGRNRIEIRRFVRDLSLITLSKKTTIIFTNIVYEKKESYEKINMIQRELFYHDIIRYVHYKFYLQSDSNDKRITECKLIQPVTRYNSSSYFDMDQL